MMQADWSGPLIVGGSVAMRVTTFDATGGPDLIPIHRPCCGEIVSVMRCAVCGYDVPPQEIGDGHETGPGQYALVDRREIASRVCKRPPGITIMHYFPIGDLDSVRLGQHSWVAPIGGSMRSFVTLRDAFVAIGRGALCRVNTRGRPRMGVLWPREHLLMLADLRVGEFASANEVMAPSDLPSSSPADVYALAAEMMRETLPLNAQDIEDKYAIEVAAAAAERACVAPCAPKDPPPKVVPLAPGARRRGTKVR